MSNVCFYYCRTVPAKILIHRITNTPSKLPSNSRQISASKGKLDSIWNILSLKTTYHSLTSLIRKPKGQNQVQATERGRDCMKFGTKRRACSKVVSVLWRCLCPEMDTDDGDSVLILKSVLRWKKYLANCGSLLVLFKRSLLNKTNYSYNRLHQCNMELYIEENVNWCPNQCDYRSIRRRRL